MRGEAAETPSSGDDGLRISPSAFCGHRQSVRRAKRDELRSGYQGRARFRPLTADKPSPGHPSPDGGPGAVIGARLCRRAVPRRSR